jgi:hypothetical protein
MGCPRKVYRRRHAYGLLSFGCAWSHSLTAGADPGLSHLTDHRSGSGSSSRRASQAATAGRATAHFPVMPGTGCTVRLWRRCAGAILRTGLGSRVTPAPRAGAASAGAVGMARCVNGR